MRLPRSPADTAILSVAIFPLLSIAYTLDCKHIQADGIGFNLEALGGPHSVQHTADLGPSQRNTTYTIDICKALTKKKGGNKNEECPNNTRVCAVQYLVTDDGKNRNLEETYPIAGDLKESKGFGHLDPKWQRLSTLPSNDDSKKEGLVIDLHGGYKEDGGRKQNAIIEFQCDKTRSGLENLPREGEREEATLLGREHVSEKSEEPETPPADDKTPSLTFDSYGPWPKSPEQDLLRLTWKTKWACEDAKKQHDAENASHWGFFTWFILIAFLSTAAYLIFGSWLNYNRYGARGWDLLPHGDTIRDVPYLMKDWIRRVVNAIQGGGSRGGYAAV
ncbi:autophagy-related protein 27 [Amylocarpus encephaloides]|uniref:Autophagy-related protein 27 n=1 Tax=Amylocarpus encephaloides TaxID=45428 RepID=A0A9P7YHL1_9HELO|nr:autophagy-related protein 27 [Amylocarpus encephaloides]